MRVPTLVREAQKSAVLLQFEKSCLDEVGEFLALLAAHPSSFPVLEVGTGAGVGTAWLASHAAGPIYTVETEARLADAARDLFAASPEVRVIHGDWMAALNHGPFGLIFVDAKPAKQDGADQLVAALQPGGWIVLDDLTPREYWPEAWRGQPDRVRDQWLGHPGLISVEVRTSERVAVILARRKG